MVTFTKDILNENFIFCAVSSPKDRILSCRSQLKVFLNKVISEITYSTKMKSKDKVKQVNDLSLSVSVSVSVSLSVSLCLSLCLSLSLSLPKLNFSGNGSVINVIYGYK